MYYITEKTSTTGRKFQEVVNKMIIAHKELEAFTEKYEFQEYRQAHWSVYGGISSCCSFKETPNPKIWGKGVKSGEFMPKKNSKIGRAICDEINQLTIVSSDELNQCIAFDGAPLCTIGFNRNNETHFGFQVSEKWDVAIPDDCQEVLTSTYNILFNLK